MASAVLDIVECETDCPRCGRPFVRAEDLSATELVHVGGEPRALPVFVEPWVAHCERGHVYEVISFDVTKRSFALTLGPQRPVA